MSSTFTVDEPTLRRNTVLATSYADQCRAWAQEFANPDFYEQYAQAVGAIGQPLVEALKVQGAQIVTMATDLAAEFDTLAQASTTAIGGVVDSDTTGAGLVNNAASGFSNNGAIHAHTTANIKHSPGSVDDAIDQALDLKGITDPQAHANWAAGMQIVVQRESGGDCDAINLCDSNAAAGHPSEGPFQFIPRTFEQYHEPGTSDYIRDPLAQASAFINYAEGYYGVSPDGSDLAAKIQQADPSRPPRGY